MNRIMYISDLHFYHANILMFDNRPWTDVEKMNEDLVEIWNKKVDDGDTVYILGDIALSGGEKVLELVKRLNGRKILIKGNHDRVSQQLSKEFGNKVYDYLEIKDDGRNVVLSHYPISCFNKHYYGEFALYGHVHVSEEWEIMEQVRRKFEEIGVPCNMYGVGCCIPYMEYEPKTLNEIIEGYNLMREKGELK